MVWVGLHHHSLLICLLDFILGKTGGSWSSRDFYLVECMGQVFLLSWGFFREEVEYQLVNLKFISPPL